MNRGIYISVVGSWLLLPSVFAQQPGGDGINQEVQVTDVYSPSLNLSFRKHFMPSVIDTVLVNPKINYELRPAQIKTSFGVEPISMAVLKGDALSTLQKGYAKAGIGTNLTPYGEFYYNNLRSRNESYGVHARHLSSGGKIKDYGYAGFADTDLELNGKKFLRKHSISGNLGNSFKKLHNYGFLEADTIIDKGVTRQRFNKTSVQAELASYYKDSARINHKINFDYYYLSDAHNSSENNLKLSALLSTKMKKEVAELRVGFDYNNYFVDSTRTLGNPAIILNPIKSNNTLVWLNPAIRSSGKNWQARFGLSIMPDLGPTNLFHFYPDAEFRLKLYKNVFSPYVGFTGRMERNSFSTLSSANPFVLSNLALQNTNRKWELYGGVRGSWSSKMSFNVVISSYRLEGLPLFVNDTTYSIQNKFLVIYDSLNVTKLSLELSYHQLERLKLYGRFDFMKYSGGNELFAWNLPTAQFTFSGVYDIADRILFRADIFYVSERKSLALDSTGAELQGTTYFTRLKGYADISLGAEYRYTKRLSAFVNITNLLATRYLRWENYPVQRLNLLAGITYSF